MLLARIVVIVESPDAMPEQTINAICDDVNSVDWESLIEAGLRHAGINETILDQLTFRDET